MDRLRRTHGRTPSREAFSVMMNQLQIDVEDELEWDPKVDARHVSVTAHNGAVRLSGYHPGLRDARRARSSPERHELAAT